MSDAPCFRVRQPGFLTTVQDLGRHGSQKDGMPVAGAMDTVALQTANLLVGNERGSAALEITLTGPKLDILADTVIAVTGANLSASIDGLPIAHEHSVFVRAGQQLRFGRRLSGVRAYLAAAGGFDVPWVLGSRATYLPGRIGGLDGRALRAEDELSTEPTECDLARVSGWSLDALSPGTDPILLRVILGPHQDRFSADALQTFLTHEYELSPRSDRMGCRLVGPVLHSGAGDDLLSEATAFGAVQIPADGQPIVLTADRQTTGGYPLIACVISSDLPKLAQTLPGQRVRFEAISIEAAQQAATDLEQSLHILQWRLDWRKKA